MTNLMNIAGDLTSKGVFDKRVRASTTARGVTGEFQHSDGLIYRVTIEPVTFERAERTEIEKQIDELVK